MSIFDSDVIRALKSEGWYNLESVNLDDLPASCFRDLDFGDVDNSVFLIPSLNWEWDSEIVKTHLDRIMMRLLFSSIKFHQKRLLFLKLDKNLFAEANLVPLDQKLGCEHYDLVGITYGLTKRIIRSAFDAVSRKDVLRCRTYGIEEIRQLFFAFEIGDLKKWFLEAHPEVVSAGTSSINQVRNIIGRIRNVYFKKGPKCPLTEELILG